MKKSLLCGLCGVLTLLSAQVLAAGDDGKIVEVYSHTSGAMAVRLDKALVQANNPVNTPGLCGTSVIEWAGVEATAPSSLKASILTAKATGASVTLVTFGSCIGNWIKIEAKHVK